MSWQEFRQILRHPFSHHEESPQSDSAFKVAEKDDDFGDTVPCAHWQEAIENEAVTFH